ncbi:DUF2087 domain-containing protein [Rhodospirillum centenum]|uniref:Uncharacterized protein n=1 Tax=Rhodospirillum centenum (strain ATCC 51521 / SW) TaxID=414684 RepID=B6IUY6_RHOCS|nr:DUF2087 domain-containing protein [Rhodospirillum centenum]ACJ00068.1 conserved hypothetical protein [Rhodospirillum centenum SW]
MTKLDIPFLADDISAVAKSLRAQLGAAERPPGHCEMLNMLARSAGYRNFQHYRAQIAARDRLARPPVPEPTVDQVRLAQLLRYFGPQGRLARWPSKFSHQEPCLWVLWSRIPARRTFAEREVNALLAANHDFGDHALLRRELIDYGMMMRAVDGSAYRRVERQPPPDARALIRLVAETRGGARTG